MEQRKHATVNPMHASHDETILVVKRAHLFQHKDAWHGLQKDGIQDLVSLIMTHQEFHPRSLMEHDYTYKQIIPYLIFRYQDRYFLMQRQAHASEQRLKNKMSLGVGGHVRQEDVQTASLFEWARREFYEEVSYTGTCSITTLGILNDDSNEVGKVHVGLVLLLEGSSADIQVKSELKSGRLYTLQECAAYYQDMEGWSQIVYQSLLESV
jgi:predicted NUDIX family phosphoesterase